MTPAIRLVLLLAAVSPSAMSFPQSPPTLIRQPDIALGAVTGRIDHLAIDTMRQRLFVAERDADAVGVIELSGRRSISALQGLEQPQGLGFDTQHDSLFVANGRDGSLRVFRGPELAPAGALQLGPDADNLRVTARPTRIIVGYGNGAIAIVNPERPQAFSSIALKGHPEAFEFEASSQRVFVNVPGTREVAVLDARRGVQTASWPIDEGSRNHPLALDEAHGAVWLVTRDPARLIARDAATGKRLQSEPTCGDADDLLLDSRRERLYVICGEGFIDVWQRAGDAYRQVERIATQRGARTALYSPELDRVFLAVRASASGPAAIWVYRPAAP